MGRLLAKTLTLNPASKKKVPILNLVIQQMHKSRICVLQQKQVISCKFDSTTVSTCSRWQCLHAMVHKLSGKDSVLLPSAHEPPQGDLQWNETQWKLKIIFNSLINLILIIIINLILIINSSLLSVLSHQQVKNDL